MTGVPFKRGKLDRDTHTEGRRYEDTGQSRHLQAKEGAWDRLSLAASEGTSPCPHLDLDFRPPELRENECFLFKMPCLCTLLWQP